MQFVIEAAPEIRPATIVPHIRALSGQQSRRVRTLRKINKLEGSAHWYRSLHAILSVLYNHAHLMYYFVDFDIE